MKTTGALIRLLGPAGALVLAMPVAQAAEPGVFVDPSSPPGKEYAIPLDTARREAAGDAARTAAPADGAPAAPLFGVGITVEHRRPVKTTKPGSPGRSARAPAQGTSAAPTAGRRKGISVPAPQTSVRRAGTPSGGISTAATVGGLAASVLLLGGVFGSIARRYRRPSGR
jgi:hypothetical protein